MTNEPENLRTADEGGDVDPHSGEVDLTLIRYNLSLSLAERFDQHDRARELALMFWRAGLKRRGIDPESAPTPE